MGSMTQIAPTRAVRDWQEILDVQLRNLEQSGPVDYIEHDCWRMTNAILEACANVSLWDRTMMPPYQGQKEADNLMGDDCGRFVSNILDSAFPSFEPVPPAMARRLDIGIEATTGALGVCIGDYFIFPAQGGGLARVRPPHIARAWRVVQCLL